MNNWYVYRHIRVDTNMPFYIGIGCKSNYSRAYENHSSKRSSFWCKVKNKTDYKIQILFDSLTKKEAIEKEKEFIKLYGRKDLNLGTLVNMTDGGDGVFSCIRSQETRQKLSLSKMGIKNPQYGKKQSLKTILKRKESLKSNTNKIKIPTKDRIQFSVISGQAKKTEVYDFKTSTYLGIYLSISDACRNHGLNPLKSNSKASLVARGFRNHHKNLIFKYVN